MRTGGVPVAALLLLVSLVVQVRAAEDIYWEGEEDASNEFLEVKEEDLGLTGHLQRLKREYFDNARSALSTTGAWRENYEAATDDPVDAEADGKDDDLYEGSGASERPEPEPEPREKTIRVTFVVTEPYRTNYSNRDSVEFQTFSRSLADAVNVLYESLPGTQRANLVRIQSRLSDEFSCKVTMEITTTGYDDTDRIRDTLLNYIKNRRYLGSVAVSYDEFSAYVVDPGSTFETCRADEIQCNDNRCVHESGRCNGYKDCADGSDEQNCPNATIWSERRQDQTSDDVTKPTEVDNNNYDSDNGADVNVNGAGDDNTDIDVDNGGEDTNNGGGDADNEGGDGDNSDVNVDNGGADSDNGDGDADNGGGEADNGDNNPWDSYTTTESPPLCDQPIFCASSSVTICRNNLCDGTEDCPLGDDEQNCPSQSACPDGEMRCDETRCISLQYRCDDRYDCNDGADERNCKPKTCNIGDFRCNNNKCIESWRRCNGVSDCSENEDEQNCNCRPDEFRCASDGSCIESRKRCDGDSNCRDNSDEENCGRYVCKDRGRFRCRNGTCISILLRCDGFHDCAGDGSDENDCPCRTDQWQCDQGSCIKRSKRCDGRVDCPSDRSDERNCIADGYFKCRNGKVIPESLRCNRRYDCSEGDYSDEQNCPCGGDDFKCNNGHCIPASKHCDRTHDCQDGSDERHCIYGTECMAYQYKCTSGRCVQAESWCNGTVECDDGSDENNCPCKRGQFQCRDGSCINIALRCNGRKDCRPSGEDEFNCGDPPCPSDSFTCDSGSSIRCAKQCDGQRECDGGEDEENCKDCHMCDGKCLAENLICDKKPDCSDGSDELICDQCDGPDVFRCKDYECVSAEYRCNGVAECNDGSDEFGCSETIIPLSGGCMENQFQCRDGSCINADFMCDLRQDCADNSDEDNCPWYTVRGSRAPATPCHESQFTCYDGRCIPHSRRCDNFYDCADFADEQNCQHSACPIDNSWQCKSGQCISQSYYCDGKVDCNDNSDEDDCPYTTPNYDTETVFRVTSTNSPILSETRNPDDNDLNEPSSERPTYGGDDRTQPGYPTRYDPFGRDPSKTYDRNPYASGGGSGQTGGGDRNPYASGGGSGQTGGGDRNPYAPGGGSGQTSGGDRNPYASGGGSGQTGGGDRNPYAPGGGSGQTSGGDRNPYASGGGSGQTGGGDRNPYAPGGGSGQTSGGDRNPYASGGGSGQTGGGDRNPYAPGGGSGQTGGGDRNPYASGGGSGQTGGGDRNPYAPGGGSGQTGGGDRNPYASGGGSGQSGEGGQYGSGGGASPSNGAGGQTNEGDRYGANGGGYSPSGSGSSSRPRGEGGQSGDPYASSGGDRARPGYPLRPTGGCNRNEWRCENGPCIYSYQRCDGHIDCPYDFSDEFDCPETSPVVLDLKTHPKSQMVRYGGDVVFQCRDEGPLRASVRWVREGGRSMRPGSTDRNGRLELFQVSMSDSGVYICQTPRYMGYPGSEVRVSLTVEDAPPVVSPNFPHCGPNEATCGNGECIPKSAVCNGRDDCSDRSDEENCYQNGMCEPNQFQCKNRKCVLKTWLCDSEDDCGDRSDEENCGSSDPSQSCLPVEFTCASNKQCVPRSFHCDGQTDCLDGSDEIGCAPVHVTKPPRPSNVRLNPGETLTLTCEAVGVPTPLITWRLNWGHVPPKCTSISQNGIGTLTCPNMQPNDSGAYSCEAINNKATTFASPDSIVNVNKTDPCPNGYFNSEARSQSECIRCFCFGESNECRSADLFTYNMPTPLGEGGTRLIGVVQTPNGEVRTVSLVSDQYYYQPLRNGATVTKLVSHDASMSWGEERPYLTLPETYNGNQLTSYGGHIKYTLSAHTHVYGADDSVPNIIIKGKYGTLFHHQRAGPSRDTNIEARLTPENWEKATPRGLVLASREDLMMVLDNIEMILLRADLNNAGVNITNFAMESAQHINVGLGAASLVEECSCPPGYEGLSCQKCASGYVREQSGPWLGNCVREACPPGTYGDPSIGISCNPCPCPLTNRDNQFARTCSLGSDGSVNCDCFPGYEGRTCEVCASTHVGNPLIPGDSCKPKPTDNCNSEGTKQVLPLDECVCKENVQGRYCDQCKNDSFYLSQDFRHGCALCFCTGVSQQCTSSNLRRKTTTVQFNVPSIVDQVKVYNSTLVGPAGSVRYSAPVETGLAPTLTRRGLSVSKFESSRPTVYYWSLPISFAGDKVTSYGGYLRYTLNNIYGDTRSRNNAADVQLISDNRLTFHYFGDFTPSREGVLNASVQFLEKGWQRSDGKEVSREHFLLALADVKTILIKATYMTDTALATPEGASIETAEPNGDGPTALHVEQCTCPSGYIGTSCEDCAPGYTRNSGGLYLRLCERCECNGHSNMCHPETSVCYDCSDNTDGTHCEFCKPGYEKDAYGNCVDSYTATDAPCRCDPRGISAPCDFYGDCRCKQNVEGDACDRCRAGTFGLDERNPEGCLSCYCSGVTTECHEGSHYARIPLAAPIFGDNYGGYTLMDLNAELVINNQFVPVPDKSELMYIFSFPSDAELFWSLPVFPGNRVLSYGGTISLRQEFKTNGYIEQSEPGTDVVLIGDDVSLYWTNPNRITSEESLSYQVPLRETGWFLLGSPTPATRSNFMRVLKNLRRVLVRATLTPNIVSTSIADVSMDTATESYESDLPAAKGVEICMCPVGHTGTSCESCSTGFYKDEQNRCQQCPCNGHDCQLNIYGQVTCNCRPPYTGSDCSTIGLIMELHPTIHDAGTDSLFRRVTFTCKYRAPEPLTIKFYNEGNEVWPPKHYNASRLHNDGWHGEHVWHTVWDTRRQGAIYECHTISSRGFTLGVLTTSLPEPVGEPSVTSRPPLRPPPAQPTVVARITSPTIKIQEVGSSVNFTCQAESRMTLTRLPVTWSKVDGELPLGRTQIDEEAGVLFITNLKITDSGQYMCQTSDSITTAQATATLKVPGNEITMPTVAINPSKPVNEYYEGDRIELECITTGNPAPTVSWQRASRRPFSALAEHYDTLFTIESAHEEDSGEYRCIASNTYGSVDRTVVVNVRPRPSWAQRDKLTVSPLSPSVDEGQSTRIVCTAGANVPAGSIDWIRQDGSAMLPNVRVDNGVLSIDYATLANQGVYVCQTQSSDVAPVPILITVVIQSTPSPSEMPNITVSSNWVKIPTGDTGMVNCDPQGNPAPLIRWTKSGQTSGFGPGSSQRENTLIINNAQEADQGYYLCEGIVGGNTVNTIFVYVEIEKREPPRVEIWPKGEHPVGLGSQFELRCQVLGGIPDPDVIWSRTGSRTLSRFTQIQPQNVLRFDQIDVNDEGEYTCTATNVAGKASASAVLKVRSPPEITITPSNYIPVLYGEPINVECRANGYPEPTVSIRSNSDQRVVVPPTRGIAAIRVSSATDRDEGDYVCTATSPAGTIEEQISIVVERGDGGYSDTDDGSGEIDIGQNENPSTPYGNPKSLVAYEGQPLISIICNGSSGFEPRWERADQQPLQRNAEQYGPQLVIRDVSKSDTGQYVCVLSSISTGEIQTAAYTTLLVLTAPKITIRPATQTVHPGQSPTVECVVEGDNIIHVSWKPYNRELSSRVQIRNSTLIFHQIEVEDAGKYECFATNSYANASGIAEVIVSENTDRTASESHDNEQFAHAGAAVHLSCNVTQPNLTIKWTKNSRPIPRSVSQKSDGSLYIKLAQKSDSGRYVCLLRDQYGRHTSNYINLHIEGIECSETEFRCYDESGCINEDLLCDGFVDCQDNSDEENCLLRDKRYLEIISDPYLTNAGPREEMSPMVKIDQPQRVFRIGENVKVLCRTRSQPTNAKWEKYGTRQNVESVTYGDGTVLIVQNVHEPDAGVYRCNAMDVYGRNFYEDFNLEVEPGSGNPAVPDYSRDLPVQTFTAHLWDNLDLPCTHNLELPVYTEWKREYSQLPAGARNNQPILHIENVTEADAGIYVCRVSNNQASVEVKAILRVVGIVPRFNGGSWVSLPKLNDAYFNFVIEISFKPVDNNGLILYNSQNGRTGDFMALQLVYGIPEFVLEIGSGPVIVKGDRPLQLNTWHTIRLSRSATKVTMYVDNKEPFTNTTRQWTFDLDLPLYIGGVPDYDLLPEEFASVSGFVGCVSMLIIGKEEKNIMLDAIEVHDVKECDSCAPNQCLNNGVCQEARNERGFICICPSGYAGQNCDRRGEACRAGICGPGKCIDTADGYKCACPVTHTGRNCDERQYIEYPAFTGSAYLAIAQPETFRYFKMSMKVKPTAPVTDGIIMYCAESSRGYEGYMSLAVRNGKLEFRYDFGDGHAVVLVSNRTLSSSDWTDVQIARSGPTVSMNINMDQTYVKQLDSANKSLKLETPMFVGGVDESIVLNSNIGVTAGFSGCIKELKRYDADVDIVSSSILSANIQECSNIDRGDTPDEKPCECINGGICMSDSPACVCPPGFTGFYCETQIVSTLVSPRRPTSDPCAVRSCLNGGTCRPDYSARMNHTCDCPLGYAGASCQIPMELGETVGFNGNGYLELPASMLNYDKLPNEPVIIALALHTTNDGVLLYQREALAAPDTGDYILLRIERGYVVLDWDMGSGISSISVDNIIVADGDRHQVIVKLFDDNRASLSVDSNVRTGSSTGLANLMNADSNIYIGGIPERLNLQGFPGLSGCIEQLELMGADRGLNLGRLAQAAKNAQRCRDQNRNKKI